MQRRDKEKLRRIFAFVEALASSDDEEVRTLAAVEILYPFAGTRAQESGNLLLELDVMGPAARRLFAEQRHALAGLAEHDRKRWWWRLGI